MDDTLMLTIFLLVCLVLASLLGGALLAHHTSKEKKDN